MEIKEILKLEEYKRIKNYAKSIDLGSPCGSKHSKNRMLFTDWNAHYSYSYKEKPDKNPLQLIQDYVENNCVYYVIFNPAISSTIGVKLNNLN